MLEGLEKPQNKLFSCKVQEIAEELEAKDKGIFLTACDNPDWGAKTLSRELKIRGVVISDTTILRHRRRDCNCE